MKATLNKSDLALHGKRLKLSRPTKSVAAKGGVKISASQEITIRRHFGRPGYGTWLRPPPGTCAKMVRACQSLAEFGCEPADLVGPLSVRMGTSETILRGIIGL